MSTNDILKQLEQDARRLRVARKLPPDGDLPFDLIAAVQQDFEQFLVAADIKASDVSRAMGRGFSGSQISTWRRWTKTSGAKLDVHKVTRAVNQWMEGYATQLMAPRPEGWVETECARLMLGVIREALKQRSMALITSDTGRGKTLTMKTARSIFPGAIYLRIKSGTRTATGLARLFHHELKMTSAVRSTLEIQLKLLSMLRGTGRLLLLDEAHQLSGAALEFVRDIHDECEIPIVLGGTRNLNDSTGDEDLFFGQLASRIAVRYDVNEHVRQGGDFPKRPIHSIDELKRIFLNDQLRFAPDGFTMLGRLANLEGFGGLRLCRQVVTVAATASKGEAIDARLMLAVLRKMHGVHRAVRQIERAVEELQVKIA